MKKENPNINTALEYLKKGFSVIPIKQRDKIPLISWKEFQTRFATEKEIHEWFTKWPDAGIGIVTGKISGIVVVDIEKGGSAEGLSPTVTVRTGGGGWHYYYKHPGTIISNGARVRELTDIRGDGGYVVAPPSIHSSGNKYEWTVSFENADDMDDLPQWILDINSKENTPLVKQNIYHGVQEGERNNSATIIAGKLLTHIPQKDWENFVWPLLQDWNDKNNPPLDTKELRGAYESIAKRELDSKTPQEKRSLSMVSIGDIIAKEYGNQEWLVERLIPLQSLTAISGHPGSYKTWLTLELAKSLALGSKFLNEFDVSQGATLFIDEENQGRHLKARFKMLGMKPDMPIYYLIQSNIKLEKDIKLIKNFIIEKNIKLVVIDSLVRLHQGDENDARDISKFMKLLKSITQHEVCVVFIHHHRKGSGSTSTPFDMRGSVDILAAIDSHLIVEERDDNKIHIIHSKLRQDEPLNPFVVVKEKTDESLLFIYEGEDQSTKKKQREKLDDELLNVFKNSKEELSFEEIKQRTENSHSDGFVRDALKHLVDDELIIKESGQHNKYHYSLNSKDEPF